MSKRSIVVLIGPPCSGKGTQVKFFRKAGARIISIGHILRTKYRGDPQIQELINNGRMVPNVVVNNILRDQVAEEAFYLFDGYPRTIDQARDFLKLFPREKITVVVLEVGEQELFERMRNRSNCELCGAVFSQITSCCGAKTAQRKDDQHSFFKRRLEIYHSNSQAIVKALGNRVFFIDATKSPEAIFSEINKKINI